MGAKQKEGKPVASKSVPAAKTENGVTDTVTIANGQKVSNRWLPRLHCSCVPAVMSIKRGVRKASMLTLCRLTSHCHAQIPVAIPPNLDPAVAKQVIEYLKANPEAAQQSYEQAHRMLQTPGMAQTMLEAKVRDAKTQAAL